MKDKVIYAGTCNKYLAQKAEDMNSWADLNIGHALHMTDAIGHSV